LVVRCSLPFDGEDLLSFIISGLNPSFHTFIIATRANSFTYDKFRDELLSPKMLLNQQVVAPDATNFALSNRTFN
jgi:hypothetical protein